MGRDAFKVLAEQYFKSRILSHQDICTVLICLSRKYSLCIKLNTYHSSSRSLQLNIYQVDTFYFSIGPCLLKFSLGDMVSLEGFLKTRKSFPSNETMCHSLPQLASVCSFPEFKPVGLPFPSSRRGNNEIRHTVICSQFKLVQSMKSNCNYINLTVYLSFTIVQTSVQTDSVRFTNT